ncbi:HAND2 (predicted) [Pycnogonum litorale]
MSISSDFHQSYPSNADLYHTGSSTSVYYPLTGYEHCNFDDGHSPPMNNSSATSYFPQTWTTVPCQQHPESPNSLHQYQVCPSPKSSGYSSGGSTIGGLGAGSQLSSLHSVIDYQESNQTQGLGHYNQNFGPELSCEYMIQPPRRKNTVNKKERRRTVSINSAFADLRDCIPNVPSDTKLSKIKTLRLATSYISYLMDILAKDDPSSVPEEGFKAEIHKSKIISKEDRTPNRKYSSQRTSEYHQNSMFMDVTGCGTMEKDKKSKGRTGWPQHVWALELNQ